MDDQAFVEEDDRLSDAGIDIDGWSLPVSFDQDGNKVEEVLKKVWKKSK